MPLSVIQSSTQNVGGSAALSITFSPSAAGSFLVLIGAYNNQGNTIHLTSVTDNNSDTVTDSGLGITILDGTNTYETFVKAFFSPTTGTTSMTANFGTGLPSGACDLFMYEVAGFTGASFDKVAATSQVSGAFDSGPSGALSQAIEFVIGACLGTVNPLTAGSCTLSSGSPVFDMTGTNGSQTCHEITSTNASLDCTAASGFAGAATWVITFQGTPSGGGAAATVVGIAPGRIFVPGGGPTKRLSAAKAFPVNISTINLFGSVKSITVMRGNGAGNAAMSGKVASQSKGSAAPSGVAPLLSRTAALAKAASAPALALALKSVTSVKSKSAATAAGVLGLAGRAASAITAVATATATAPIFAVGMAQGFLFHPGAGPTWELRRRQAFPPDISANVVSLSASTSLSGKPRGALSASLAMTAFSAGQARGSAGYAGIVGLLGKAAAKVQARAGITTIASLQALGAFGGIAAKARAGLAGTVGLAGVSKVQAKVPSQSAATAGLSGRAATVVKAKSSATYGLALATVANVSARAKASAVGVLPLVSIAKAAVASQGGISAFVPFMALSALTGAAVKARAVISFIYTPVASRTLAVAARVRTLLVK